MERDKLENIQISKRDGQDKRDVNFSKIMVAPPPFNPQRVLKEGFPKGSQNFPFKFF